MYHPRIASAFVHLRTWIACALLPAHALAQSFNVDLHGPTPATIPSAAYGAAAGQAGHWNAVACPSFCDDLVLPLANLAGASTSATLRLVVSEPPIVCDDPSLAGDEEAFLETGMRFAGVFNNVILRVEGLAAGTYDVYVYAGPGCSAVSPVFLSATVHAGSSVVAQQIQRTAGAPYTGTFVDDQQYGRFRVRVDTGNALALVIESDTSLSAHGFQLVKRDGPIHPVCFGTNEVATPCPCGTSAWERGCPSSFQPLGAALAGQGTATVSADTVQLVASDVSNSAVTFFQGTGVPNFASGSPFGDGLLCASGSVMRIATRGASQGVVAYPQAGEPALSTLGLVPPSGGRRVYQVQYRNAAPYCTAATFNLTNAVAVEWVP